MNSLATLLLHPKTRKQTVYYLQNPVSPLLILGERGSGKLNLAYSIARTILSLGSKQQLSSYPYFFHAKKPEDKQDISIDTIREINRFLRLKTPGDSPVRRVVLVEDSHFLSPEAQNALLKILEEPNNDTLFLLTAPYELSLLPTIASRCQHIWAHPVTIQQAEKFYGSGVGQKKMETAWRLSQGSASLLDALLSDEDSHPLKQAIEGAKTFLRQTKYERLMYVEKRHKNKEELSLFLEALAKILSALHRSSVGKNNSKQMKSLVSDRKLVLSCLRELNNNTNSRLLCLNLVLKLKS